MTITKAEIFSQLQTTLHDTFEIEPEKITLEARLLDDLEIDSIDAIDLLVQLKPMLGKRKIDPAENLRAHCRHRCCFGGLRFQLPASPRQRERGVANLRDGALRAQFCLSHPPAPQVLSCRGQRADVWAFCGQFVSWAKRD